MSGLSYFFINPKGLVGENLFCHIVQKQLNDPMIKLHDPSVILELSFYKEQVQDFVSGEKDFRKYIIMIFVHVDGANTKLVTRNLDNFGYIKSYDGAQNDPERLG